MTWKETTEKAKSLGWRYGSPRRSNLTEWYKVDRDGNMHFNGSELWKKEVENGNAR